MFHNIKNEKSSDFPEINLESNTNISIKNFTIQNNNCSSRIKFK